MTKALIFAGLGILWCSLIYALFNSSPDNSNNEDLFHKVTKPSRVPTLNQQISLKS